MRKGVSLIGDVNPLRRRARRAPVSARRPAPDDVRRAVARVAGAAAARARSASRASRRSPTWATRPARRRTTLAALDAQIARANADGLEVALTLYQAFPDWTRARRGSRRPPRQQLAQLVPDDRSPDGPWAWLVAYLCARYARGGAGNPGRRRTIDWLEPMNEPNLTWWPQRSPSFPGGTIAGAVAELARSAATVAAAIPGSPGLLLPATSDVVSAASPHGTPWDVFSDELLAHLRGWEPGVPVGWAQHNYADVKLGPRGRTAAGASSACSTCSAAHGVARAVRVADRGRLPVRRAPRRLDRARPRALGRRPAPHARPRAPRRLRRAGRRDRGELERDGAPARARVDAVPGQRPRRALPVGPARAGARRRRRAASCTTRRIPPTRCGRGSPPERRRSAQRKRSCRARFCAGRAPSASVSSSTPCSSATSRSVRPEAVASLTISAPLS